MSRDELERLVLRLVLSSAIQIHFVFTAYSILSYLYVRPSIGRSLASGGAGCTADELRLTRSVRSACDPLPAAAAKSKKSSGTKGTAAVNDTAPPKKAPAAAKRKASVLLSSSEEDEDEEDVAAGRGGASSDDDFAPPCGSRAGGRHVGGRAGGGPAVGAASEPIVLD